MVEELLLSFLSLLEDFLEDELDFLGADAASAIFCNNKFVFSGSSPAAIFDALVGNLLILYQNIIINKIYN